MSANLLCVDTVRPCPRHICLVQPALSMCVAKKDDLIDRIVGKLQVLDRLTKKGLAGRKTSFFLPQDWHKNLRAIWAGCVDQTESDRTGQLFSLFYLTKRKQR